MFTCCRPHRLDPAGQLGIRLSGASAAFHPWKNIEIGFVNFLFSLLNTPCLELIGTVPGSAITTMPTISWCSWNNVCEGRGLFRPRWKKLELIQSTSRTTLVTSGTRSRASFSPPSSSATTTSRFVHVNTALQWICLWNQFSFWIQSLTILRSSCVPWELSFQCRWGDISCLAGSRSRQEHPQQTLRRGALRRKRISDEWQT